MSDSVGEKRKAEGEDKGGSPKEVKVEKTSSSSSSKPVVKAPIDDDPDWDDDKPICELMVSYMKKKAARAKAKAKEELERAEAAKSAKKSSGGGGGGGARAAAAVRKDQQFYETKKGMLVQRLLVRWWYAYDWPMPGDWDPNDVPAGYEELDGYPGVFVSMNVTSLGKLLDLRDSTMKPSLKNMSKKSAQELQELCVRAYENQILALEEAEGVGVPLLSELRRELHQVKKVHVDEADQEARKFVF
jgi:hypothetical protein